MKTRIRFIFVITLFLMPVFTLAACNNNEPTPAQHTASAAELNYEASVVGSSLSAAGVEYAVEMNIYELEEKIDSSDLSYDASLASRRAKL